MGVQGGYPAYVAKYVGPCNRCGQEISKQLRPGKEPLCLECANLKVAEHNRSMADGTNPQLHVSYQKGHEVRQQIKARKGPAYARWVGSMQRYLDTQDTTTDA